MTSAATDTPTPAAVSLARFVTGLDLATVPEEVKHSAKLRILDMLGIIVGSRAERGPATLRKTAISWGGRPEATLFGGKERLSAPLAALVNGMTGHALDFDDTHHESRIHASTVVVPAALAAAEANGADGDTILKAVVAGLETVVRVGVAAPGRFHERGLHATSLAGVFGAAAAAATVLGLDTDATVRAFGIAGSTASGLREAYLGEPTDTKAFHAGWAAQAGVMAAQLASGGFTGPTTVFEGRFGYYNAFVSPDKYDVTPLGEDNSHWYTPEIVFKLYPCGSLIHAMIDAAIELREKHGLSATDLTDIVCIAPAGMVSTVLEPISQKLAPQSGYHAKFSAQYCVAVALLDGTVTESSFSDARVKDPEVLDILSRVTYETDPHMRWPEHYPGGVRVTTASGEVHETKVPNSPGSLDRPATLSDIGRKFRGNVENLLSDANAAEVIERVMNIESEASLKQLTILMGGIDHEA